jgi:hypothetical protein
LPEGQKPTGEGEMATLMGFIYQWFCMEKRTGLPELKLLFGVGLPDKIYYLSASASVLFKRLEARGRLEAHESEAVLERLGLAYGQLLQGLDSQREGLIQFVDANRFERLDQLFEELSQSYP